MTPTTMASVTTTTAVRTRPAGERVNSRGCSCSQRDDDGDGVNNCDDECPDTPAGSVVNDVGCTTCPAMATAMIALTLLGLIRARRPA
jgi:hypothetical protein